MKDTIIKGTGDSRYLKSAIPENITHAQLVQMLRNGTFPIDLNGINEDGIEQMGTPLNTATLLSDETGAQLGLTDGTVNEAILQLTATAENTAAKTTALLADINTTFETPVTAVDIDLNGIVFSDYREVLITINGQVNVTGEGSININSILNGTVSSRNDYYFPVPASSESSGKIGYFAMGGTATAIKKGVFIKLFTNYNTEGANLELLTWGAGYATGVFGRNSAITKWSDLTGLRLSRNSNSYSIEKIDYKIWGVK